MKYGLPLFALIATPALSKAPLIEAVGIEAVGASPAGNAWRIDVASRHPDTGWDHYADGWGC